MFDIESILRDKKFWDEINAENDKIYLEEIKEAMNDSRFNKESSEVC